MALCFDLKDKWQLLSTDGKVFLGYFVVVAVTQKMVY